jgi:hypothetical protein
MIFPRIVKHISTRAPARKYNFLSTISTCELCYNQLGGDRSTAHRVISECFFLSLRVANPHRVERKAKLGNPR